MRNKLGFFTYRLPYPLASGGQIRAYYLLRELAKHFEVHLFSFYKEERELENKKHLDFCSQIYTFPRRPLRGAGNIYKILTQNWASVSQMLRGYPFASALYFSPETKKEFEKIVKKQKYAAIQFESFYPGVYLDSEIETVKVFGTENIEYQVYEKYVRSLPFPFNQVLKLELMRMRFYEERLFKLADQNLAVSEMEKDYIEKVTGKEAYLVPNGVDVESFATTRVKNELPTLLYIGNVKYFQNREAVKKILYEIYPKIKTRANLLIVSDTLSTDLEKAATSNKNITVRTDLKQVQEAFKQADILLVPVYQAGGTRIKVLEAMASQVAVVATKIGVAGLDVKPGQHFLAADTPAEFVREVEALLAEPNRIAIIKKAALELVKDKYDWQGVATNLVSLYKTEFLKTSIDRYAL